MHEKTKVGILKLALLLWMAILPEVTPIIPRPLTAFEWPYGKEAQAKQRLPEMYSNVRVTERDLEEAVEFAKGIMNQMKTREKNLMAAEIGIKYGSPSHGNFIAYGPDEEAIKRGRIGHVALKASTRLVTKVCGGLTYNWEECAIFVNKFNLKNTVLGDFCSSLHNRCDREELNFMYRSVEGRCNNELSGSLGEAFTGYQRLLEPQYITLSYIRRAYSKKSLPTPREITIGLVNFKEKPHDRYTMAVSQWGQFVEHDMSRSALSVMFHTSHNIDCCEPNGRSLSPRYVHPFCAPIRIPYNDSYYNSVDLQCMSYVRSIPAVRADCSFGTPEQMNQVTHFLDASQIYGSTYTRTSSLREFIGGRLNTSRFEDRTFLPKSSKPTVDCQVTSSNSVCFRSGDARVNLQPRTTALYTVLMREHNRLARELASINPGWDDETIFQEARRIVIAEVQHITYKEWLPVILGPTYIRLINLNAKYSPKTDPSVSNSFATAAIRALTSLYTSKVGLYNEERVPESTSLNLNQYFNKPGIILKKDMLDRIIRGLTTQTSEKMDMSFSEDIINKMYSNGEIGYDILSLDIERGRDHGLPSYTQFSSLCGLPTPRNMHDLVGTISKENVESLREIYDHPSDIDLLIGGLMESPEPESLFGPTLSCIIADQFLRSKQGDRYFYTNPKQPKPFTNNQLQEIRKVTLARILCDNADNIKMMQWNSFEKISETNHLLSCESNDIPRLSLIPWMEDRERYSH